MKLRGGDILVSTNNLEKHLNIYLRNIQYEMLWSGKGQHYLSFRSLMASSSSANNIQFALNDECEKNICWPAERHNLSSDFVFNLYIVET